jgi:hypothetical protein
MSYEDVKIEIESIDINEPFRFRCVRIEDFSKGELIKIIFSMSKLISFEDNPIWSESCYLAWREIAKKFALRFNPKEDGPEYDKKI